MHDLATTTTNYGLKKPSTTDKVSIADINGNMDIIDAQIKANNDLIATKFDKSGGTISGAVTVNGNITAQYVTGTWLRSTLNNHHSSKQDKVCVQDSSGWVYHRTLSELKSDLGIRGDTEVDLAFDESTNLLTVTVNGTSRSVDLSPLKVEYSLAEGGSF